MLASSRTVADKGARSHFQTGQLRGVGAAYASPCLVALDELPTWLGVFFFGRLPRSQNASRCPHR
jgi:hypothetical protein